MVMNVVTVPKLDKEFNVDSNTGVVSVKIDGSLKQDTTSGSLGIRLSPLARNGLELRDDGIFVQQPDSSYFKVGVGRPDVPASTSGKIAGDEPDGTIYISTDGANVGAYQWVKSHSKWYVTKGDTGWIRVESDQLVKGAIFLRRTEAGCYISVRGGDWDSFQMKTISKGKFTLYNTALPVGFTSPMMVFQELTYDAVQPIGFLLLTSKNDSSRIQARIHTVPDNNRWFRANMLYYISDDVWVDSLTV